MSWCPLSPGSSSRSLASRLALATLVACLCAWPSPAAADWYITPFVGNLFHVTQTNIHRTGDSKLTVGGSVALISSGILGVEADFGYTPRFLETDLALRSHALTLTGNVLVAAPLSVTRESLRPYLVGGVGWLSAATADLIGVFPADRDTVAVSVGGGAIGLLSERAGVRFDVRWFRDAGGAESSAIFPGAERMSFWRASVGVTLRY